MGSLGCTAASHIKQRGSSFPRGDACTMPIEDNIEEEKALAVTLHFSDVSHRKRLLRALSATAAAAAAAAVAPRERRP